uniref:Uncharacterized protein n=1 Tax=Anopheles atroparvus TaxID=41427 RepID=A0AAG5DTF7_ANOAO
MLENVAIVWKSVKQASVSVITVVFLRLSNVVVQLLVGFV